MFCRILNILQSICNIDFGLSVSAHPDESLIMDFNYGSSSDSFSLVYVHTTIVIFILADEGISLIPV